MNQRYFLYNGQKKALLLVEGYPIFNKGYALVEGEDGIENPTLLIQNIADECSVLIEPDETYYKLLEKARNLVFPWN